MNSLKRYFESEFDSLRSEWQKSLLEELKLSDLGNKDSKKILGGLTWPILSLERQQEVCLSPRLSWKKASTTYAFLPENNLEYLIADDLSGGVRNFFFLESALNEEKWQKIERVLSSSSFLDEIDVFFLGEKTYSSTSVKIVGPLLSGQETHDKGGSSIQELALLCKKMILSNECHPTIAVFVDSNFFHNIAKIRAARLLAEKILQEKGGTGNLNLVALTSYRNWTLFERYSNMLRNEASVASAYIGGADHIQSSGYNILFELETDDVEKEHFERSQRMARNTTHILALESMLGVVEDAAFGSYHLENLTAVLCEESWKLMQRILKGEDLSAEISQIQNERLERIKTRKSIISGINDFPDSKESLDISMKRSFLFRDSRIFEELRLKVGKLNKPEVYIAIFGDYGGLNSRMNFVRNYFELLGLKVYDPGHSQTDLDLFKKDLELRKEDIIIVCSRDDQYPILIEHLVSLRRPYKFVAGKIEVPGFKNLFLGQNIYDVLCDLVKAFSGEDSK